LKNATSQVNIVALEQEKTQDVSQLGSFVFSGLFTDLERYHPVKQSQAGEIGVSCFFCDGKKEYKFIDYLHLSHPRTHPIR
jgi:hypothetical protein